MPSTRTDWKKTERDDLVVDSQEYSKSGFDSWAAETENTAFSKKHENEPDEEVINAAEESKRVSPQIYPWDRM